MFIDYKFFGDFREDWTEVLVGSYLVLGLLLRPE